MAEFLQIPLKKPAEVNVVKPLKNLIQSSYNSSDKVNDYTDIIVEFDKLRNTAIWKVFEKFESSLEIIYNYYDQLCALETKIPVHELQIPFKWKDAFDKGSIFGGRMSLTLTSLGYEKVCVLFNIAALQSSIAASQSLDNDDGLKLATKLFQQSAGILNYLKSAAPAAISQEPTPDLNPETLTVLSNLMIAQAQETFIVKAIRDSMKDTIIAKLACQCEELYAEVLRGLQKDALRGLWEKDWVSNIAGKQAGFHAISQLYQSLVCRANQSVGEEISRLQNAVDLFKAAQSRSGHANLFEEYFNRAQRNLTESKKDNDFIYNEMIPDFKSLESPGKAQLAKPLPLPNRFGQSTKDLFSELVPVALHQAISASDARKNEIVNGEIMKLREATQTLNGVLASLNLPAAIEIMDNDSGLPPSLLEKAREVSEKGGYESIQKLMQDLPELLNRNHEILNEAKRMLNEEKEADQQLRNQFKEKWSRTPSEKLTEMFRANESKYYEIINRAVQADGIIRGKFEKDAENIALLSKSPAEIHEAIPSAGGAAIGNSPSVLKLRSYMENVETIKAERDVIESELKSATIDMKDQFLKALAADGAINEPAISISTMGLVLGPLQSQIQESIKRQEELITNIQSAHRDFTSESGSCGTGARDKLMCQLASAYDTFINLQKDLKEGTVFYNDLTQLLVVFQNKVSDYCFARKMEKEELLKDLTQESSRQQTAPLPSIPSHHPTGPTNVSPTRPAPAAPATAPTGGAQAGYVPYPQQMQGMPIPYGASVQAPYPTYVAPPMPQSFNPYATLPYPNNPFNYQGFPQAPQHYGTYPGSLNFQQQQQQPQQPPPQNYPGYPQQQQQPPPGW